MSASTHSLTQHGPDDSMKGWLTNFNVQISFEALTLTKTEFFEIPPPPGGRRQAFPSTTWLQIIS